MFIRSIANKCIINVLKRRGRRALAGLEDGSANARKVSNDLLMRIVHDNKDTEYGRKYHFDQIHSVEDYQRLVPFSTYDDYAPYIERMTRENENGLITAAPPVHYAVSSGSVGAPKNIPVSQEQIDVYVRYTASLMFGAHDAYSRKTKGKPLPAGRGLSLIEVREMYTPNGVYKGPISGTLPRAVKNLLPYIYTSPLEAVFTNGLMNLKYLHLRFALEDPDLSFMIAPFVTLLVDLMTLLESNWKQLCDEIEQGTLDPSASMPDDVRESLQAKLKPNPRRAAELRKEFERGFDTPIIPRIWKRMWGISTIGSGGFSAYTAKMRRYSGDTPIFFMVYGASESLFAAADKVEDDTFVMIPEGGFYEFIPEDGPDEGKPLTISQLEVGRNYEIVVTNLSGFYRYKIKDVVQVVGFKGEAPRIRFQYRKNQMLSIAGEKTNSGAVEWAIQQLSKEIGVRIPEYSVYADISAEPGRYVLVFEPETDLPASKVDNYARIFERYLAEANPSFGEKITIGTLGRTAVHISQPETYALYRDIQVMKGASINQLKPVRVLDNPMKERFFLTMIKDETAENAATGENEQ